VYGGGQERGLRSGTENVAGIVGFGRAAELAELERATSEKRVRELSGQLVRGLASLRGARVLETGTAQLGGVPGIVAVLLPGLPSEVRMHHLEELGVVVSAGSACQSKKTEQSPVLTALGITVDDARTMLRISLSRMSTSADIERFLAAARAVETQHAPA
jgi:cysteine desulfurase